jgi:hypothetical protein
MSHTKIRYLEESDFWLPRSAQREMVNIENRCSVMGSCIDFLHSCRCKEFSPAAMSDCRRVPICGRNKDVGRAEEDGRMADGDRLNRNALQPFCCTFSKPLHYLGLRRSSNHKLLTSGAVVL